MNMTLEQLRAYFRNLAGKVTRWFRRGTIRGMNYVFGSAIRRNFDQSKTPEGDKWAPVRRGGDPLILSGKLRAGAIQAASEVKLRGKTLYASFAAPRYGVFHQYGTSFIIPRKFFGLDQRGYDEGGEATLESLFQFIAEDGA